MLNICVSDHTLQFLSIQGRIFFAGAELAFIFGAVLKAAKKRISFSFIVAIHKPLIASFTYLIQPLPPPE